MLLVEIKRSIYLLVLDRYLKKPIEVKELVEVLRDYFIVGNIKSDRNSIKQGELVNNMVRSDIKQDKIILYKKNSVSVKIYSAVLSNLGYLVDSYTTKDDFLKSIDSNYKFALFDIEPFRAINSDEFVIKLIKSSGVIPILFVDRQEHLDCCDTILEQESIDTIIEKLKKCS